MQKRWVPVCCLLWAMAFGCLQSCGVKNVDSGDVPARVLTYPYDEVWAALETLVLDDMGCAAKTVNKKKGRIETEWVHKISTRGTTRWMIAARIKKKKNGVWVHIEKKEQIIDEERRKVDRYRPQRAKDDMKKSGWKSLDADTRAVEGLYQQLISKITINRQ